MFAGTLSDGGIQLFQPKDGNLWTSWKVSADPNAGWTAWSVFPIPTDCAGVGNGGAAILGANNETLLFLPQSLPPAAEFAGGPDLSWATKGSADSGAEWEGFFAVGPGGEYSPAQNAQGGVAGATYVTAARLADGRATVVFYWYAATVEAMPYPGDWPSAQFLFCTQTSADPAIRTEWSSWSYALGDQACLSQPTVVPLADGRLQVFAFAGREVVTNWMTDSSGSHWSGWSVVAPPKPQGDRQNVLSTLASAQRADRRAQVWATFDDGLYTNWKSGQDPDAAWTGWNPFMHTLPGIPAEIVAVPLSDGRLQLWFVMQDGRIYSSWETQLTELPNASWAIPSPFAGP